MEFWVVSLAHQLDRTREAKKLGNGKQHIEHPEVSPGKID